MTTTASTPSHGVDNYDWLQAIADHPYLDDKDLVAAYGLLGTPISLTSDDHLWALYNLETEGFVRSTVIKERSPLALRLGFKTVVRHEFHIPNAEDYADELQA